MRRWIALLSLLSLANVVFVRGGASCPFTGEAHHQRDAGASAALTHEGHEMRPATDEQPASGQDSSHQAMCLTMGPCVLTVDVVGAGSGLGHQAHHDGVLAMSYHRPHSLTLSPELPPPRA